MTAAQRADREWVVAGTCRIARDRATATVAVVLTSGDNEIRFTTTWHREPPDRAAGHKIARRWYRPEGDDARWSVEYGYDGRWWILFGPAGSPWAYGLADNIADSLIEATEYAARVIAWAKDPRPEESV